MKLIGSVVFKEKMKCILCAGCTKIEITETRVEGSTTYLPQKCCEE